jgi:DNA polymerase-3 subunit alpha
MAAVMTIEMDNTDGLVVQKRECAALGIEVLPPDVNVSMHAFDRRG